MELGQGLENRYIGRGKISYIALHCSACVVGKKIFPVVHTCMREHTLLYCLHNVDPSVSHYLR